MGGYIKRDVQRYETTALNTQVNKEIFDRFKDCCKRMGYPLNLMIEVFMQQYVDGQYQLSSDAIMRWKQHEGITDTLNTTFNKDIYTHFKTICKRNGFFVKHVIVAFMESFIAEQPTLVYMRKKSVIKNESANNTFPTDEPLQKEWTEPASEDTFDEELQLQESPKEILESFLYLLRSEMNEHISQLITNSDPKVVAAYRAYVIEKTRSSVEKVINDSIDSLQFIVNSTDVYALLHKYAEAISLLNSSDNKNTDPKIKNLSVILAKHGISRFWLQSHDFEIAETEDSKQMSYDESDFTYKKIKGGIRVDDVKLSGGVVIPEFIEGLPVIKIGSRAFYRRKGITSVVLPQYLTEIADYSFAESGITSIVVPDSVEKIGEFAFSKCKQLTRIKLPEKLAVIKAHTFTGCDALDKIAIPPNVTSIGDWVFDGCKKLLHVQVPNSVTRMGYAIFPSKVTLYCDDNSRAHRYTKEHYMPNRKLFDEYPKD